MRYEAFPNQLPNTSRKFHIRLADSTFDPAQSERLAGLAGSTYSTFEKANLAAACMNAHIDAILAEQVKQ